MTGDKNESIYYKGFCKKCNIVQAMVFLNPDMIGHTGNMKVGEKSYEIVDICKKNNLRLWIKMDVIH